jgi:death-on-curing protein
VSEFLTLSEVLHLHELALARHGGQAGIRDQGLLESAVAQPEATMFGTLLHSDLWEQAAAYAFHIAENQPFVDGNKRAAVAAALTFLRLNGCDLQTDSDLRLYRTMIAVANHQAGKPEIAAVLRQLAPSPKPAP